MRALGLTRWGTAGLVGSQALVLGAVMLLVGVPLGLAIGRAVWRPIVEAAHVVVLAVYPWGAVGLIVGAVVLTGGRSPSSWRGTRASTPNRPLANGVVARSAQPGRLVRVRLPATHRQ